MNLPTIRNGGVQYFLTVIGIGWLIIIGMVTIGALFSYGT